jgi:hypothetical protein
VLRIFSPLKTIAIEPGTSVKYTNHHITKATRIREAGEKFKDSQQTVVVLVIQQLPILRSKLTSHHTSLQVCELHCTMCHSLYDNQKLNY